MVRRLYSKLAQKYFQVRFEKSKRRTDRFNKEIGISEIKKLFPEPGDSHAYFHHFYWNLAPEWLKAHREYFSKERRAFGEDAFHAMWFLLFKEERPVQVLEIGVYRGSTLSLFALLSEKFGLGSEIHGISPFSAAGDSVSKYLETVDYYEDVQKNFRHFNLPPATLHRGYSTDPEMVRIIESRKWDVIFIDGNHDYEVARQDFINCAASIRKGGLIILDDSALYNGFRAPFYSNAGHPGPSKVASEIDPGEFTEILSAGHNRVFKKI